MCLMINSKDNSHFKRLLQLHKKSKRDESSLFLVEGEREVSLATNIEALYFTEETQLVRKLKGEGVLTFEISPQLFSRISYRDKGVIAIVKKVEKKLEDLKDCSLLLLCEGIEKPGNLGAMMRSCDGASVKGIIICDPRCDLFNPNVIRASLGAFFTIPFVQTNTQNAIEFLKENSIQTILATPHVDNPYFQADFTSPTCIVIGSESQGASSQWELSANVKVNIPMNGKIDSLNASVSASLLIYEALRQRNTLS